MTEETIRKAIVLAREFIALAEHPQKMQTWDSAKHAYVWTEGYSGMRNASIKRKSMDLSRALSEMRGNK